MQAIYTDLFSNPLIAQAKGGDWSFILTMGLFMVGFWFLLIAPQRKKQKDHEKMISELTKGERILTTGGLYGTITAVKDDRFVVQIAENTKVEINKSAVQNKLAKD